MYLCTYVVVCCDQVQEFRTGATRQNMDSVHSKEETKRVRQQLADLRDKLNDLENKVTQLYQTFRLLHNSMA